MTRKVLEKIELIIKRKKKEGIEPLIVTMVELTKECDYSVEDIR